MTTRTLTYTGELVVTSCWCGIRQAIPSSLYEAASQDHRQRVYCPLGHGWVFSGETDAQRLRRDLKRAEDQAASARAERDQVEASRRAWKGQVTRLRKRVIEGDCPLCGQHLRDLERHVARIHPGQSAEITEAEASE